MLAEVHAGEGPLDTTGGGTGLFSTYIHTKWKNGKNMVLHLFGSGLQAFQESVGWDSLNTGNKCIFLWNLLHIIYIRIIYTYIFY